jgi:hypothetical protein
MVGLFARFDEEGDAAHLGGMGADERFAAGRGGDEGRQDRPGARVPLWGQDLGAGFVRRDKQTGSALIAQAVTVPEAVRSSSGSSAGGVAVAYGSVGLVAQAFGRIAVEDTDTILVRARGM